MVDLKAFKEWMSNNTDYTSAVIRDNVSRIKRADAILAWNGEETYLFYLEKEPSFMKLSVSVRSQIRKAVKLYTDFSNSKF